MATTRHTVATLLAAVPDADLATAIRGLYWRDQDKDLDAYLDLSARLRAMAPASTHLASVVITREWSEDETPPEAVFHIHGKTQSDGDELFAIEYTPWEQWLSLPIEADPEFELSDAAMLANLLYEMSWAGFEQDEIAEQKAEIMERKEEVDRLVEEGRIGELREFKPSDYK